MIGSFAGVEIPSNSYGLFHVVSRRRGVVLPLPARRTPLTLVSPLFPHPVRAHVTGIGEAESCERKPGRTDQGHHCEAGGGWSGEARPQGRGENYAGKGFLRSVTEWLVHPGRAVRLVMEGREGRGGVGGM